ncbi:threonine-phosphate decarboxylase CobD [Magnetospira sp. QH-2]|uniref:threonine-phosphate decarboxylase CobD n=1 Tax=Magnetospira sp. (strain QH-2) TaxID=1288970 RepID=UPI00208DF5F3|nr:threonine-phosphate decarboxylase CobD [Magnetospira sp. QH-2]
MSLSDFAVPLTHGGALDDAANATGIAAELWLDLSTGINPTPYPVPETPPETWQRLPDQGAISRFKETAAHYYGVSDSACITATPGTQAAIQWLPRLMAPGSVAVRVPTYEEHGAAWALAGHSVQPISSLGDISPDSAVAVVVNPNNPTGETLDPSSLLDMADRNLLLVVDEAFADPRPDRSLAAVVGHPNLVILRSFGKFFGLAGLRLGTVLAAPDRIQALERAMGPWPVSGPALVIGALAMKDRSWIETTRKTLAHNAVRLRMLLSESGFQVVGGTDLFVLASHPQAPALYDRLRQAAILTRSFPDHPAWLRFGLPAQEEDWDRLRNCLFS